MHNRNHSFPSNPFGDNNGRNVESTECTLHWFVYLTPYFSSLSNQINTAGLMGKTWREGINRFSGAQKVSLPKLKWRESSAEQSFEALPCLLFSVSNGVGMPECDIHHFRTVQTVYYGLCTTCLTSLSLKCN